MISNVIDISQTIPKLIEDPIPRNNLIQTIDMLFNKGIDVVALEGDEGCGKTVTLRQFCEKYPNNTISLFVGNTNSLSYDPANMRFDICNQIHWMINSVQLSIDVDIDDGFLRQYMFKVMRIAKRRKEIFYFVIDGLADIPNDSAEIRASLLDSLPLGQTNIKFLISGDASRVFGTKFSELKVKPFPVPMFSLHEAEVFFGALLEDREFLEDVYKITNGVPSHLDAIRRLIASGISIENLKNDMPEHLKDIFEIEWSGLNKIEFDLNMPLAILAFDECNHTAKDIGLLIKSDIDKMHDALRQLSFINIDEDSGYVNYISEEYKKFAANRLSKYKSEVVEIIIENMYQKKDEPRSLSALPEYLDNAGRHTDLLELLSTVHLKKLLKVTCTLGSLRKQSDIGVEAALKIRRDGDLFRLSYIRSVVSELGISEEKKYEIEAYVTTSRYEEAIELANSAVLIEDRLHLLSVTARALKCSGQQVESTLKDQVESLFRNVNAETLDPDKALDIAGELFSLFPDYAINLVETSVRTEEGENSMDLALAKLSFKALENKSVEKDEFGQLVGISSRVTDKTIKSFLTTANAVISNSGIRNIIEEVDKLEKSGEKLFVLKKMVDEIPNLEDSFELIEYALKLAITSTQYSPNAGLYRSLSQAIPKITSKEKRDVLIGYIDSQKQAIKDIGPTDEFVRLQLILAEAESILSLDMARDRLINLYLDDISEISDAVTKAACLAWFVATLVKIDPDKKIEKEEGVYSIAEMELKDNIPYILNSTADQFHAIKEVIVAISSACIDYAEELSDSLNIVTRRDDAYCQMLESIVDERKITENIHSVLRILDKITNLNDRVSAIFMLVKNVDKDLLTSMSGGVSDKIFELINSVPLAKERFYLSIVAYNKIDPDNVECLKKLSENATKYWNEMPDGWRKVSITFQCVSILFKKYPAVANEYMELAEKIKRKSDVSSEKESTALVLTVHLLVRSYRCLIEAGLSTDSDFDVINKAIQQLDDDVEKVRMWCHISCFYYLMGEQKKCKELVFNHLKASLDSIGSENKGHMYNAIMVSSPALWVSHKETFYELLEEFPSYIADVCFYKIFKFILVGAMPGEPEGEFSQYNFIVHYTDILDIIELANKIESDARIYDIIKLSTAAIIKRQRDGKFSRTQTEDLVNRLYKLIADKLPSSNYIKHDGFKLSSLAQLYQLEKNKKNWTELILSVDDIPNLSDRAIVYSFICDAMPSKMKKERIELIKKAKELVDVLPDLSDQIDRYEALIDCSLEIDPGLSKELLTKAFSIAISSNDQELRSKQKRLIDMAYKFDPELPSSLASLTNDDPSKKRVVKRIDDRVEHLELISNISDERKNGLDRKTKTIEGLPDAAWKLLGTLNIGRTSPVHIDRIRQLISSAALLPLGDAYPVYSYAIENARLMYKETKQANEYFRPIFESATQATEILLDIMSYNAGRRASSLLSSSDNSDDSSLVINVGEREKALKYIKEWLLSRDELNEIKICDPYFGVDELEILKTILEINPYCTVTVLTSELHHINSNINKPWDEAYKEYWRHHISDQDPLDTEIIISGVKPNGASPIHDRWIISDHGGLRLGTSLNSLGKKISEISIMDENTAAVAYEKIEPYITKREKMHASNRISYQSFDLY